MTVAPATSGTAVSLTAAALTDARDVAALAPMPQLLESLGFEVNGRTRRAPCLLHLGSNPTAFAWRDDGRWHCFSCHAGGDKIALVRAVRRCSFREAVEHLAALTGVEYRSRGLSARQMEEKRALRSRAESAAWLISDEIGRLRRHYTDALHRAERLQARIGNELLRASSDRERGAAWDRLARLAPACTFFCAAWGFVWKAKADELVRFAVASGGERRRFILEGEVEHAIPA